MEAKIVALIRKYINAPFALDKMEVWADNLATAFQAAEVKGHGGLAEAVFRHHLLSSMEKRRAVFEAHPNPLQWLNESQALVKKYNQYL